MSKPVFSQSKVIRQLTASWGDTTHPRQWYGTTVTYSIGQGSSKFPPAGNELFGLTAMTAVETSSAGFAFRLWQDLIPINLVQSFSSAADITLNYSSTANDGSSADGKSSYTHVDLNTLTGQPDQILGERIWIGTDFGADFDPNAGESGKVVTPVSDDYYYLGGYLILNLMHEIGHALGLSHPDTYDVSSGKPLSYDNNATYTGDFRKYSIMSYFGAYKAGVGWTSADDFHSKVGTDSYPQTPMRDDILAIQALYGANFATRSGATHYGFNTDPALRSTVYDFTYNKAPLLTIWDGGGIDTLDLSAGKGGQTIDLRPGAYSSVLGLVQNVAIAYNCVIENAVGGRGNDTIIGNSAANVLTAGLGNDRLEGGDGSDVFPFSTAELTPADRVVGGAGFDQLAMRNAGTVAAGGVSGVETYVLAAGAANRLTLVNANFAGVTGGLIRVFGGDRGNTIDASALTGTKLVAAIGGAGGDAFRFSAASLLAGDSVAGGGGADTLSLTSSGKLAAGGVGGIESYRLASLGANSLTLRNANFDAVTGSLITVFGGAKGNAVNASAATGSRRLAAVGGAGRDLFTGGAGNDLFRFAASSLASTDVVRGGGGADQLLMTTAGPVRAAGVAGVETYTLSSGGADSLSLTNANFTGAAGGSITIYGGGKGSTVSAASVTGTRRVTVVGAMGKDVFTGGAGNDAFRFAASALAGSDVVRGGLGADQLLMTTAGTVRAAGVAGVETYTLSSGGADSLSLTNANFTEVTGGLIRVAGGSMGNTVSAAVVTGARRLIATGGAGKDRFTGGAGNDVFRFTASALAGSDVVRGGGGSDQLAMDTAGTVRAGGIAGVESYVLSSGGANSLTLTNPNFAGVGAATIRVTGGGGADSIRASGLAGSSRVVLSGGGGADTLIVGRLAALTGGAGNDRFDLTAPGTVSAPAGVTIADFAHGADKLGLGKAGFGLGAASVATVFKANLTGGFTAPAQRFAYDTTDGRLFFDRDGSRGASPHQLIATLAGHPTLAATDIFFFA